MEYRHTSNRRPFCSTIETYYERVLLVVQSPLQIIGAAQWLNDYLPRSYDLVLIYDPRSPENFKQMRAICELFKLGEFEVIENTGISSFLIYTKFIKHAVTRSYDCVLIGGYGSFHQALIANLNVNIFLIDDGSDAFNVLQKMKTMGPNWGIRERGLKVFRFKVMGLKVIIENENRICFYSFLLDESVDYPRVINHRFGALRTLLTKQSIGKGGRSHAYFVDTPLVESGLISLKANELVYQQAKAMSGQNLVYIPHRGQHHAPSHLLALRLGLEVVIPETPVEIYFLINSLEPSQIFGTSTSAIFSLKILFPKCQFFVFDVRPFLLGLADIDSYDRFYDSARREGISIIPVES
jgi:hypothetical protein